ncbi:hypothetical protein IV498_15655 [Paenarthrobacter sp. Z7-10]|nr:hypothetical protein [Paenarthrobacter sp. Z7-10]
MKSMTIGLLFWSLLWATDVESINRDETATLKEVRRLQRKHHNGQPREGASPGALRPGQRTKTEQDAERKSRPMTGQAIRT